VTGNNVTIGTRKGGQSAQSVAIEFLCANAGGNRRLITVGRDVLIRRGVALVTDVVTRRAPATAILEATPAVVATLVAAAVPTTIITTLETAIAITTVVAEPTTTIITTLETTIAITTVVAEPTTTIITTLETTITVTTIITTEATTLAAVGTFPVAIAPLRLALLVSTTAEFAASSSLFCHGVYPLFLRRLARSCSWCASCAFNHPIVDDGRLVGGMGPQKREGRHAIAVRPSR